MEVHVRSHGLLGLVFLMLTLFVAEGGRIINFLRREHSLVKPYQGSGLGMSHWDFLGNTIVTNNHISLTPEVQGKYGAIWSTLQCHFDAWELHIQFKIHGRNKKLFGDGLAVWYTKERMRPGPVFGNADSFTGLAVFLDTYNNDKEDHHHTYPYISAMVNNGTVQYDKNTDGTHTQLAGCESQFRNKDYDTFIAIRYEGDTISVSTDISNKNTWKKCLSVSGIKLQTGYYFGVSAATGDLTDNHDIISIKMYDLDSAAARINSAQALSENGDNRNSGSAYTDNVTDIRYDHNEDGEESFAGSMKNWNRLFLSTILVVSAGGLLMSVIFFFQNRQEQALKRIY